MSLSGEDSFVYIRSAFFVSTKCLWFSRNACIFKALSPPRTPPHHFLKLNFISKILNFTMKISAYQEGTKINTEMNERPSKNIGTHWNIRHRWFQRVPISFSLAFVCLFMLLYSSVCCVTLSEKNTKQTLMRRKSYCHWKFTNRLRLFLFLLVKKSLDWQLGRMVNSMIVHWQ